MKKIYILAIIIATLNDVNAQIKSGLVSYNVTVSENKESELEKMILSMNSNFYSVIKEFEFSLLFSKEKALFSKVDKLYSDDNAAKFGHIKIGFLGNNLMVKDSIYSEGFSRGIGNYIKKQVRNKDWILLNETKLIDNYLCYKATTEHIVVNEVKTFRHPIIAWYCPEIPFSYGPLGYGGLPGLILELQTKDGVFGANKIQLNAFDIVIDDLKAYKIIDERELNELIEKKNSN